MAKKPNNSNGRIAENRRARHDYFIEEKFEAGVELAGWEVKSLRAGRASLTESYVVFRDNEAFIFGSNITPLLSASTHVVPEAQRTRKLLLSRRQIDYLMGKAQQKGYTCLALTLYWKGPWVKCEIALAKGKQLHDKRDADKERDWKIEKSRIMRDKL